MNSEKKALSGKNYPPGSGLKDHTLSVQSSTEITKGTEPGKFSLSAVLRHENKERVVNLVERADKEYALKYAENWEICKKIGLPVVPTLRVTTQDSIVMTNLTADGSQLFGKAYAIEISKETKKRSLSPREKRFLELTDDKHFSEIEKQVRFYAELACNNEASLPFILPTDDAFELIIHPSGDWKLILLDLTFGALETTLLNDLPTDQLLSAFTSLTEDDLRRKPISVYTARAKNEQAVEVFLTNLKRARELLLDASK